MRTVDVVIPSFYRAEQLEQCLEGLTHVDEVNRVYVADQGGEEKRKELIYNKYREELPLTVIDLEYDSGLANARNAGLSISDSEYILFMDDDHRIRNITPLIEILEQDKEVGAVSGITMQDNHPQVKGFNLKDKGNILIREPAKLDERREVKGYTYYLFDFIDNCALFRRECLDQYSWDNFYKIGSEHVDFYWKHKKLGEWKFAICTDTSYYHEHARSTEDYVSHRTSNQKLQSSREHFYKKFKFTNVITRDIGCHFPSIIKYCRGYILRNLPLTALKYYDKIESVIIRWCYRK